jgi:hypothetical protein
VRSTVPGSPLVWFQTGTFATSTFVDWTVQYESFTSQSDIIPGGVVRATNHYPTDLGQTLHVTGDRGTGQVVQGGTSGAVSIQNDTEGEFTCGISQAQFTGQSTPMCAFPLYGGNLDVIAPIEKVLLMFASKPLNTGTVVMRAYTPSVLVDLTGARSRLVNYDINKGWSWGGATWAQQVKPNQELAPLLVETDSTVLEDPLVPARRVSPDQAAVART